MRTALLDAKRELATAGNYLLLFATENGIDLPDKIAANIAENESDYREVKNQDNGFHAATLFSYEPEMWAIIDPNFNVNRIMNAQESGCIQKAYLEINSLPPLQRGVNRTVKDEYARSMELLSYGTEILSNSHYDKEAIGAILDKIAQKDSTKALRALKTYIRGFIDLSYDNFVGATEHKPNILLDAVMYHILATRGECPAGIDELSADQPDEYEATWLKFTEEKVDDFLETLIIDYLFPDAGDHDLTKSLRRYKKDARYRANRIDDLSILPFMVFLRLSSDHANDLIAEPNSMNHSYLEVGNLEYRMGVAVLSDFAVHCDDHLPPTFWTSHWSSDVAWADHMYLSPLTSRQHKVAENIAKLANTTWLTYAHNHEKIIEFLERGTREKGDDSA
jgi:hypothetical protein